MPKIKTALLSVYDKTGIEAFAKKLSELGIAIISTGGTSKLLEKSGIPHRRVEDLTKFSEVLGGRVKTLHPNIFMGILSKRNDKDHVDTLEKFALPTIDLVVVNLYPFVETISKPGITVADAVEQIDIGGVSLLRAAAKNYKDVVAITSPDKYTSVLAEAEKNDNIITEESSLNYATEVFSVTSSYDSSINAYFGSLTEQGAGEYPDRITISLERTQHLRYGENPHQKAAFYHQSSEKLPYNQLSGKELSYNNLIDIDAAISLSNCFAEPTVAIIKHTNPCGVGTDKALDRAFDKALATDPVSAFGGIIGCNCPLDLATAEKINKMFVEVVIATDFEPDAYDLISQKKNLRLIKLNGGLNNGQKLSEFKSIYGGVLVQERDDKIISNGELKFVTSRKPTEDELNALKFGWKIIKYVKSNAILFCSKDMTLGIGTGQMSRIDSAEIAIEKAKKANLDLKGSAMISDAFFPFRDGIDVAAKVGATAVIQPGGSIRDEEVVAAAEEHNIAMVFTGVRHFRH